MGPQRRAGRATFSDLGHHRQQQRAEMPSPLAQSSLPPLANLNPSPPASDEEGEPLTGVMILPEEREDMAHLESGEDRKHHEEEEDDHTPEESEVEEDDQSVLI